MKLYNNAQMTRLYLKCLNDDPRIYLLLVQSVLLLVKKCRTGPCNIIHTKGSGHYSQILVQLPLFTQSGEVNIV